MEISDFVLIKTVGNGLNCVYLAEVTVTTGWLFWRKSSRRQIFRELGDCWAFVDTGENCPGFQCSQFERAWRAKELFDKSLKSNQVNADV